MDEKTNSTSKRNGVWIRLSIFLLLIAAMVVLYKTGCFQFFLNKQKVTAFLESLGPASFLGFILLQAMQVVFAPIPGEVTGLIGGYVYGAVIGVTLSSIGLTIGSFVAFILARSFGRPFVEKFIDKSLMDRFDYLLHHKGLFLIFLLFLIPGFPKDYLCFIVGLGHISTVEFLMVSSVGRLFGTILLTLGGGYWRCEQYGRLFFLAGIAIIVLCLAIAFKDRIEEALKSLHLRHHGKVSPHSTKNNVSDAKL